MSCYKLPVDSVKAHHEETKIQVLIFLYIKLLKLE